jgi:hypothetical protein
LIDDGARHGLNPVETVGDELVKIKNKLSPHEFGDVMSAMFTNKEARKGWQAYVNHFDDIRRQIDELNNVDPNLSDRQFKTATEGPEAVVRRGEEGLTQLEQRFGQAFEPVISRLVKGLEGVVGGVETLDKALPGAANGVLGLTSVLLTAISALGAIGFVAPAVKAGAGVLGAVATGVAGSSLLLPGAAGAAVLGIEAFGSHYETPERRAALDRLAAERRSLEGGPQGATHDGFDAMGRPIPEPANIAPGAADLVTPPAPPPPPQRLDIILHADPGVSMSVAGKPDNATVSTSDPGRTTNRP